MKTKLILLSALFLLFSGHVASGQFTVTLPKLPVVKKNKPTATQEKPAPGPDAAQTPTKQLNSTSNRGNDCSSMESIDKARVEHFSENIKITIDLGLGKYSASSYTCDLSTSYVRINSAYRT